MKKVLVVLMALAMVVSMLAAFPFAASADEEASPAVWSGKANIKWYLDALEGDPNAKDFHLSTAEDLAGLSYLVNAYFSGDKVPGSYKGVWYDKTTGEVLGFAPTNVQGGYRYDYEKLGFYVPRAEGKLNAVGETVCITKNDGEYVPEMDEEYENTLDNSAVILGVDFQYKNIYLDADIVINEGDSSTWGETAPANVWMPIGGGRNSTSAEVPGFNGSFYGQGHTIRGLYFSDSESYYVGLFGKLSTGASVTVQDLVIEDCYFSGVTMLAGLSGRDSGPVSLYNVHVKNVQVYASGSNAGGMIGSVHGGSLLLDQCSAVDVHVEAMHTVAAMVASLNFQSLLASDCLITGYVRAYEVTDGEGSVSGGWDVGALSGRVAQATLNVSNLISVVTVVQEATESSANYSAACGLIWGAEARDHIGKASANIEGCYYVSDFQASGEIAEFPLANQVTKSQLTGKAPKQYVEGFDFEEVWDYGAAGELPFLRNAGKSIDENSGDDHGDDPVDPNAHQFTNDTWVREKAATCDTDGVKAHYHCPHCGKDFDREGNELTDLAIPALGHTYGNLIPEKAATADAEGEKAHYECSTCHKLFDENKNPVTKADITIPKTEKKGCFGVIAGVPFIAVVVFGAALAMRKKEDENK